MSLRLSVKDTAARKEQGGYIRLYVRAGVRWIILRLVTSVEWLLHARSRGCYGSAMQFTCITVSIGKVVFVVLNDGDTVK